MTRCLFTWAIALAMGLVVGTALTQDTQSIASSVELRQSPSEDWPLELAIHLQIPKGIHVYTEADHFFEVADKGSTNLGPVTVNVPPTETIPDLLSEIPGATAEVLTGMATITIRRPATAKNGAPWSFQGYLRYQACSDTLCFPPEKVPFALQGVIGQHTVAGDETAAREGHAATTDNRPWQTHIDEFEMVGRMDGYVGSDRFVQFLQDARAGRTAEHGMFENLGGYSPWIAIPLILLGGFLLNLTPCVLPMIPVNLAVIGAGTQAETRGRGLALGAVYGVTIAVVYGALGVVVALSGSMLDIFGSPWFNLAVAIVFVLLGLATLGVFNIDFSRFGSGVDTGKYKRGSWMLAVFMAAISALLAGACVAPVVIAVLLLAVDSYNAGNYLGLLYPFLLGTGMGLPWPFAGAGMAFLPKPGGWMKYVKVVFAIFIFGLAFYYGQLGVKQLLSRVQATSASVTDETPSTGVELDWYTDLSVALSAASRNERPLLIDFWATWCKNCHVMETTTFRDEEVRGLLQDFVLLKYQAEDPGAPHTKPVLDHFNVLGLPTYIVLQPVNE